MVPNKTAGKGHIVRAGPFLSLDGFVSIYLKRTTEKMQLRRFVTWIFGRMRQSKSEKIPWFECSSFSFFVPYCTLTSAGIHGAASVAGTTVPVTLRKEYPFGSLPQRLNPFVVSFPPRQILEVVLKHESIPHDIDPHFFQIVVSQ